MKQSGAAAKAVFALSFSDSTNCDRTSSFPLQLKSDRFPQKRKAIASSFSNSTNCDRIQYRFALQGVGLAGVTVERFFERVSWLYEQGATASRIGEYAHRWLRWVTGVVCRGWVCLYVWWDGGISFLMFFFLWPCPI